ncbi:MULTISPECIES: hypothetical protein [Cyanophyceae]|uniref:hypothetical protein n=1 Tax=Cyanophyceae TaxID=3028117 RepID=UPI00168517B0|nr:hypothetical protein [Trichocoleus sp. FACHB-40]MBD2004668.1 hypothetical protein [Trichocoleus sp. FACHB-40]
MATNWLPSLYNICQPISSQCQGVELDELRNTSLSLGNHSSASEYAESRGEAISLPE